MDNIKFSVFDIFAYLLPGSILLLVIVIISTPDIGNLSHYVEISSEITLSLGILAIILAYMLGNVTDNFGSWLYYKVGCKIWGEPYPEPRHPRLSHAKQRALIREYSPENYAALQTWKVLKTMSHNLSFTFLLFVVVSTIRYFQYSSLDWIVLALVSIISTIVFLNRANVYDRWHYGQMLETVEVLNLEKKAKSEDTETKKVSTKPSRSKKK